MACQPSELTLAVLELASGPYSSGSMGPDLTVICQMRYPGKAEHAGVSTADHNCWVCRCDTFFLASCAMEESLVSPGGSKGCDISHRGGDPGFIQVQDSGVLTWADYIGNMTFTTLGERSHYFELGVGP